MVRNWSYCGPVPGILIQRLSPRRLHSGASEYKGAAMKRATIAISDPNQLFREGLQQLLRRSQFTVATSAKTLAEALDVPGEGPAVDMVVCGLDPDSDLGPQLAELDRTRSEAAGIRFVVLAPSPDRNLLCRAVAAGVDAVLSKNISGE